MNKYFRYPGIQKPDDRRETDTDLYARELRISLVDCLTGDRDYPFIRRVYWAGIAQGELVSDSVAPKDLKYLLNGEGAEAEEDKS